MSSRKKVQEATGVGFYNDQPTPFQEGFAARYSEVHCSSSRLCTDEYPDKISISVPFMNADGSWPERVAPHICCWNDGDPIGSDKTPIPIPVHVDHVLGSFRPYKWFCSGACAKRWIVDHPLMLFNSEEVIKNVDIMMKKFFGFDGAFVETAPPLETLIKYNGWYTTKDYRKVGGAVAFSVHEGNFVSHTMVVDAAKVKDHSEVAIISHMPRVVEIGTGVLDTSGRGTGSQWRIVGLRAPSKTVQSSLNTTSTMYRKKGLYEEYLSRLNDGTLEESEEELDSVSKKNSGRVFKKAKSSGTKQSLQKPGSQKDDDFDMLDEKGDASLERATFKQDGEFENVEQAPVKRKQGRPPKNKSVDPSNVNTGGAKVPTRAEKEGEKKSTRQKNFKSLIVLFKANEEEDS